MKKLFASAAFGFGIGWLVIAPSSAQTPEQINYQGKLISGSNLVNGTVGMNIRLWPGPFTILFQPPLYEDSNDVTVVDGIYSTIIGDGTVSGSLTNALTNTSVWVEMAVNGVTLSPREKLNSVAYALRSANATYAAKAGSYTGAVADSQLSTNIVRLNGATNAFAGVIAGNGSMITNISGLSLVPPVSLVGSNNPDAIATVKNTGGGPAIWAEATNATALFGVNWGDGNALFVANAGTGPSAVFLGGNVGVGSQTPAEKLTVNGIVYSSSGGFKFPDDSVLATATNLLDKTVGGTVSGPVNFSNAANTFAGKFAGDGAGLTNISLGNLSPGGAISWKGFPEVDGGSSFNEGQSFALGDVNGDGWTDAVGGTAFGDFRTYLNNTSGYLAWTYTSNLSWNIQQVALGDFNGDGRLDAAAIDSYYRAVFVLTNNGNGLFTRVSSNSVPFSGYRLVSEDITGDGRPDLIAGSDWFANIITVYTNNGSGGFVSNATYQIGTRGGALTCVDLTGDGRRDLIIGSSFTNAFTILTNRGTGAFFSNATFNVGSISIGNGSIGLVTAADLNNDGKLDLATIGGGTNLLVYTNNGTGGFTVLPAQPQSAFGLFVTALKANDDDWTDLAVENNLGFYLLLNNGSGVFSNTGTTASSSSGCQMRAADMNGDGNTDLVRLDYKDAMEVFFNTVAFVGNFSGSFSGDGSELSSAAGWYRYYNNPYNITYTYNRVGIGMSSPTNALDVNGNVGAYNYYFLSDSRQKENFAEVDHETVLEKISAMKVSQWNYKHEPGVLHIGPMAQDFHAAFGLGPNDVSISTSDEGGVALAAIQALNAKLERENAELKKRLEDLAKRLQALEAK